MGFQSQEGQVGFRTQASKGSYADPGTSGVFANVRSGALAGNRELLIPDPEIGGNRDIPTAYLGPIAFAGEYEIYPRAEVVATLLNACLGNTSTATGTPEVGTNTHTITPDDVGSLPWLSVEEQIAADFETFNYTDAKVNSFHLEADANGYLMGTAGLVALSQTSDNTKTASPTYDTTPLMVGSSVTVQWKSSALPAKSFSLDINNNLEDDDFRLGSVFLGDISEKRRELSANFTIRPADSDIWKAAVYGSSAATSAQAGASDQGQLDITIVSYEVIGATATNYTIDITVPKASIRPIELSPSGDDIIEHDMEVQFLRPAAGTPIVTIDVINEATTVA